LIIQRKRVAKRLASGLLAGALAIGGLAMSGGSASANTPTSLSTMRLAGADRYETATKVARDQLVGGSCTNGYPTGLVIASGETPWDALAASTITDTCVPILLVQKDSVPASVSDFIADMKPGLATGSKKIRIIGGESVISADTLTAIQSAATTAGSASPPVVSRVSGDDRYGTAAAIAALTGVTIATDTVLIVSGTSWADALSAAPLAALKGWPVVPVGSPLSASSKATLDSYIALPGSSLNFIIVGGESAVSDEVVAYLDANDIPFSNVRRLAGADRYDTNLKANLELYVNHAGFDGGNTVALASGLTPWDALAASGWSKARKSHIVLTPTPSITPYGGAIATLLSTVAAKGQLDNGNLYVIGGNSAVSQTARAGYVAASGNDLTATLTCPDVKADETGTAAGNMALTLSLSGKLESNGTAVNYGERDAFTSSSSAPTHFKKNTITQDPSSIGTPVDLSGEGAVPVFEGLGKGRTYQIPVTSTMKPGDVFTFTGWTEGTSVSSSVTAWAPTRSIASATCTVGADTTAPTVSLRVIPGTRGNGVSSTAVSAAAAAHLWVSSTEAITMSAVKNLGQTASKISTSDGGLVSGSAFVYALNPSAADGYATQFLILFPTQSSTAVTALSSGVSIAAGAILDRNGNSPLVNPYGLAASDSISPSMSNAGITATASAQVKLDRGSLRVAAVAAGAYDGAKGSLWKLRVVNERGLLRPSIVEDTASKTIIVTADTGYHSVADVETAAKNAMLENAFVGNWDVGISNASGAALTDKLTATVSDVSCTPGAVGNAANECGVTHAQITISSSEPFTLASSGISVSINGLGTPYAAVVGIGSDDAYDNLVATFEKTRRVAFYYYQPGTALFNFTADANGVNDTSGNRTVTPLSVTVS